MDLSSLTRKSEHEWWIPPTGGMRVPGVIYGSAALVRDMDEKVREQVTHVAMLPGIQRASYAMPDAHWGYGFPIGGVAAFDPREGGVVSAGGVGFDISCGVRTLHTGLGAGDVEPLVARLAQELSRSVPAGVGSRGRIHLDDRELDAMLEGGARWAVERGYGVEADLDRIEEHGRAAGAAPSAVSPRARRRQQDEMGTLGSGNHYLELQRVAAIYDDAVARAFGVSLDDVVVSIHCGSRGLGHQIGTEFLRDMAASAPRFGIVLPDLELACAPVDSEIGQRYLGAMRAGINCALANRQIITHLLRKAFATAAPRAALTLLYDVSHNTCKLETHTVDGRAKPVFIHRKGATRSLGPGHPDIPAALRDVGQPVLVGGTMGTESYILVGTPESERLSFSSSCHGAGRAMSRTQALRTWKGRQVIDELAARGIVVRSPSPRGVAEEAPGAYKDVSAVVDAAHAAGLSRKVARLVPLVCVKG
ncbi:MAG: RNA-splicing ligase RtcB [Acidobacteria bacterium RIFCSPLOWO2_02_FULL_68_18]|nr:MAG: RNA-splicing ligase RtcB [Acidobacteria bacterium RIFCSPLOWO2_02_FULL_68_18]OFW48328.1 MAG: RNA-splicing ligase RtcB [Acidobacteria bacterium RIFCSPLOWO2_12_FULL_68_19]